MSLGIWLASLLGLTPGEFATHCAAADEKLVLVVAAPDYRAALVPWIAHRRARGFRVELIDPVEVVGPFEGAAAAEKLREAIAARVPREHDAAPSADGAAPAAFVLLVGDAPAPGEQLDISRLVPAAIETEQARPSSPKRFVSDNGFGLPDARGRAQLAVGRWPARNAGEVAVQVQKSLKFEESQRPGPHRREITFLATTPNYSPAFDPLLEQMAMGMINSQIKPHWGLRALYSSPLSAYFPGPEETQRQVVRWLEDATPFTLFTGHGYDQGVDTARYAGRMFKVLDSDVAERVAGDRPGTLLWISACSCGDYDLAPPRRGLAEALMMNPRGPTAAVAGSDETSAWPNLLLCLGLAHDVIDAPPATLGEAFLRFKRAAFKPGPPLYKNLLLSMEPIERPEFTATDHQFLYNLLGDPTLALNLPRKVSFAARVSEQPATEPGQKKFVVSGTLDDWESGNAVLSLVIDRTALKERVPDPALRAEEAERRAAYFDRFVMANDKLAARAEVAVRDGQFEAELSVSESLATRVRWLQIYVSNSTASGSEWSDGAGAVPLKLVPDDATNKGTASNRDGVR